MIQYKVNFCSINILVVLFSLVIFQPTLAQQLAFPGAEGYGQYTTGGRGGVVIEVTNLNDSGEGSLRAAIETNGPRTIVFKVSGTIELQSNLNIKKGNVTIAGQTAPGDGICIRNYTVRVDTSNVIIRYMRFRMGDVYAQENDAIWGRDNKDIIIDHCSMSWSTDEASSFYDNENFTMQWCLVAESLNRSVHGKGDHGYGGIWGGMGATFHHNLLAHHKSRNPRFQGSRYNSTPETELVDYVNNVIYNWGDNSAYGGEGGNQNIRLNYYKYGPATSSSSKRYRIIEPSDTAGNWYVADNFVFGYPNITADNWSGGVQGSNSNYQKSKNITTPFPYASVQTQSPEVAYELVLENVGAVLPKRDVVDSRIVDEVRNQTATFGASFGAGTGIIDTQGDVGGWPLLLSAPAPEDSDHDGMPDEWELANGLNANDAEDRNGDLDGDGYTNLEEYLNSIVPTVTEYILQPTMLTAELDGPISVRLNWADNSNNENGFRVERATYDDYTEIADLSADVTTYFDEGLEDYTLYKYRVIAYNDTLSSAYSNVAEITTSSEQAPPDKAVAVFPAANATFQSTSLRLKWQPAPNATSHDIYFGTENPPVFLGNTTDSLFTVEDLEMAKKYYWRIDEANQFGTTVGTVNSFTTIYNLTNEIRIAYWPLDKEEGITITDKGGFRNHGYREDMSDNPWVNGISDDALNFDGVDDRVVIENFGLINFGEGSFTISLWVKVNKYSENSMYLLSKGSFNVDQDDGTNGAWYGLELNGDELSFSIDDNANESSVSSEGALGMLGDDWNHVVAVRDTDNNKIRLYHNGRKIAEGDDVTGNIANLEELLLCNSYFLDTPFNGALDEIKLFNYALTTTEILEITNEFITGADETQPAEFVLDAANYPNPFNPVTTITYQLPEASRITIEVFDILGSRVATLINEYKYAGKYSVRFDASTLTSGLYIYRLTTPYTVITRKMTLIK